VFYKAYKFNSDLSQWNVNKVISMSNIFKHATMFNQVWCSTSWASIISDADFSNSQGKVICCPPGNKFNAISKTCGQCEIGQYNDNSRVTNALPTSCAACPRNTFGPIAGLPTCSDCKSNQYRYVLIVMLYVDTMMYCQTHSF
jgi:surface protein